MKGVGLMDKEKLGLRVKELRELSDLTQEKLAAKAGISRNYISSIENGRYSPSIETLNKIAKALDVTVLQILDNHVESMENRVSEEINRLQPLFNDISKDQLEMADGLIV